MAIKEAKTASGKGDLSKPESLPKPTPASGTSKPREPRLAGNGEGRETEDTKAAMVDAARESLSNSSAADKKKSSPNA